MGDSIHLYVSEIPMQNQQSTALGISVYQIDEKVGKLVFLEKYPTCAITNVSCIDSKKMLLYVTAEEPDEKKKKVNGDRVLVLKIDPSSKLLKSIVDVGSTLSPNPVYVTLDRKGQYLIVANHTTHNAVYKIEKDGAGQWKTRVIYDDATVVLYSLKADGTINRVEDVVIQEGNGPLRTQTHAHPHCAVVSPTDAIFAVCDKGADKVFVYSIEQGQMKLLTEPYSSRPGDEPRFCVFHPTRNYLYVNHEGNLGLDVLKYSENGELTHVQTVITEPDGLKHQSDKIYEHQGIAIHPTGEYLYSVARGVDAMAVFKVHQTSGRLEIIQLKKIDGAWPRCCQLTPNGNWLVVGTRDSGDLILYRVEASGILTQADAVKHSCGVAYVSVL